MKTFLVIFTILILTGCSHQKAELLSYGIVDNEIIVTKTNTNLVAGEKHIINSWNLIKSTTDIPNKIGTEFGIAYTFTDPSVEGSTSLEEVIIFPGGGLTNPKNNLTVKVDSEFLNITPLKEQYFSYTINYPWEAKSGTWIFQVKQNGNILLEQTFNIQ